MPVPQGRFTSPDDFFKDSKPDDPQSWNKYIYVRNNPLKYVDPSGEKAEITIRTDDRTKRGEIMITASFAVYAAQGSNVSARDLQKIADKIQFEIQAAWNGSFADSGYTFVVTANITSKVMSEADARAAGDSGKIDNLIAVTDTGPLLGLEGLTTEAAAQMASNPEKNYDYGVFPIQTSGEPFLFAHEFTHGLGNPNLRGTGSLSDDTRRPFATQMTNVDFRETFGQLLQSHFQTHHKEYLKSLMSKFPRPKDPITTTTHTVRQYWKNR